MTTPALGLLPAQLVMTRYAANAHFRKAVDATAPEYPDAVEARAKAIRLRGDLHRAKWQHAMAPSADSDDAEWLEWLDCDVQIGELERLHAAKVERLNAYIAGCEAVIGGVAANPDELILSLQGDLAELMRDVAEVVGRLNGRHTAAAIVASGDAEALSAIQELTPLTHTYDDIYQAFGWLTDADPLYHNARSEYLYNDDLASEARIKNIDDVFPAWKQPSGRTAIVREWESDPRPWPKDPAGQLIWLVTSGAEPWLPTRRELRELRDQKIAERAHPNGVEPQPQSQRQDLGPSKPPRPEPQELNDAEMFDDDDDVPNHDSQSNGVMPDLAALRGAPTQ